MTWPANWTQIRSRWIIQPVVYLLCTKGTEMLRPRGQSGLVAKILASFVTSRQKMASALVFMVWPRPWTFGFKHLTSLKIEGRFVRKLLSWHTHTHTQPIDCSTRPLKLSVIVLHACLKVDRFWFEMQAQPQYGWSDKIMTRPTKIYNSYSKLHSP